MSILNLTAQSKQSISTFGYGFQTHSLSDIVGKRVKALAFCEKCYGAGRKKSLGVYSVRRLGLACSKDVGRTATNCPDCGEALFWSRDYSSRTTFGEVNRHEFARGISGVDPIDKKKLGKLADDIERAKQRFERWKKNRAVSDAGNS